MTLIKCQLPTLSLGALPSTRDRAERVFADVGNAHLRQPVKTDRDMGRMVTFHSHPVKCCEVLR
jgi:hypothetical protein